ncbi:MAG: phospholipase D-like domain-containing protein [Moraxellaceae bacterium]|nr:phospholipase D-like domain-containing protein [Moraxellaceae bacterium]
MTTPRPIVNVDNLFRRVTGSVALAHHRLQLLRDSSEHEAATLEIILSAKHHIFIENYRLVDDDWGQVLLEALCHKAQAGVQVFVLVDWLGSFGRLSRAWRRRLQASGGEFRFFNPPVITKPLGWIIRNHRKLISIDGCEAIISGWCLSAEWRGNEHVAPWRDTGVRVSGQTVALAEEAFSQTWSMSGGPPLINSAIDNPACPLSNMEMTSDNARVRLLVGRPQSSPLLRLDLFIIALAQERIWITDAYPVGTPIYLQALREAASQGVDVRLLVPGSSDLPLIGLLSRSSYRALLEAGVKVYEWDGSMLHAKTAVIDGMWCRVGSSNLNPASWIGNYELDLVIEDGPFAEVMEAQFEKDLTNATEIVLSPAERIQLAEPRPKQKRTQRPQQSSVTTLRLTRAVAMAVRESRPLSPTDASLLALLGTLGMLLAIFAFWKPEWIAWPLGFFSAWISIHLLRIANRRYRKHKKS